MIIDSQKKSQTEVPNNLNLLNEYYLFILSLVFGI